MIIFPMAGLSSRFVEQGYNTPKFKLPLWGGYVLDFAILSFYQSFDTTPFLFIYRETGGVRAFLEERTAILGLKDVHFAQLLSVTTGQAETVEFGLNIAEVPDNMPLTIFNIDTFRNPNLLPTSLSNNFMGSLEVFRGTGENWSFVRPSKESPGLVTETSEKVKISDLCSNGLYHFATSSLFREALAAERVAPSSRELYIAPIYNHLISSGIPIGYTEINRQDISFCGVPSEYEDLSKKQILWPIPNGLVL